MAKILFVDDEPKVLNGLRRTLLDQTERWEMSFTSSTTEATAWLTQGNYDAAVLDVKMPGKNGLDLLAEIKADSQTRYVEVIMLTGLQDQHLKSIAISLGATDLLNKPVLKEDLIARLNSAVRIKQYHDQLRRQKALLEQMAFQSKRMEIIGMLATEAVQDLDAILSAIVSDSRTALYLLDDSEGMDKAREVEQASERALKIIRRIVDFSKKRKGAEESCDLSQVVDECLELLRSSFPEAVTIRWNRSQTNHFVEADASQMYQALINLCTNAAQAMSYKGSLTISTSETQLDSRTVPPDFEIRPGPYVAVAVSNTGGGINQFMLEHIFSPAPPPRSSGLSLFVTQQIVKKYGGMVTVANNPGEGVTFMVYLPAVQK